MVNFLRLSALFAYDLKPVSYMPVPGPDASGPSNFGGSVSTNASTMPHFGAYIQQKISLSGYELQSIGYKPIPVKDTTAPFSKSNFSSSPPPLQGAGPAFAQQASAKKNSTAMKSSDNPASCGDQVEYDAPAVSYPEFPPYDQTTASVYRYREQRSVNMGSWFVHENWMTPSVFRCASGPKIAELDIATGWGSLDKARAVLEQHWDTFIRESDFTYLADIGINTVRIPIGYWTLGPNFVQGTPFEPVAQVYANSWPRVLRAIAYASKAGIGVLVDLHGAVGSQNGQAHSGVSDGQTNLFTVPTNMDKTIAALVYIAQQLESVNNVVGIQILNEPQNDNTLTDFYSRAIDAIRAVSPSAMTMPLYLHDGFDLDGFSTYVASRTDFVVHDHHSYFVFTPSDQSESGSQHIFDVKGPVSKSLVDTSVKEHRNFVVDEWSCALNPQSLEEDSDAATVQKDFCTSQMKVYSNASAGWSFWAYKKEDCQSDPGWCFTAAVGKNLPSSFFTYGKAASIREANALAQNVSDNLIIPTVTAEILNLLHLNTHSSFNKRNVQGTLVPRYRHRFEEISRRDTQSGTGNDTNAMKASTSKGYSDGFTTCKVFASYNMSRLGFRDQFIMDAIKDAGSALIALGTEDGYHGGFMQGLQDAEKQAAGSH